MDIVDISFENVSLCILEDCMTAAYLFVNYNCISFCKISFSHLWGHSKVITSEIFLKDFTPLNVYFSNYPL